MWNLARRRKPSVPSVVPNFTLLGGYLGISDLKNTKICQKFPELQTFSPRRGESLARFQWNYMRVACLRNVLKFGSIWFLSDKFVGIKLRWVIPPQIFEAPSSETTGRTQKVKMCPKMVRTCSVHMPSLVAICRRRAAREEKWVFFVCLFFVCHAYGLCISGVWTGALTVRAILLPFIGRFWCSFQRFLKKKCPVEFAEAKALGVPMTRRYCMQY